MAEDLNVKSAVACIDSCRHVLSTGHAAKWFLVLRMNGSRLVVDGVTGLSRGFCNAITTT